ncbi:hypothetical protein DO72_6263 [Burkholderia pseudomallei]|nr:hypothetical protein DO72_6263 [Burkholderia pseudomallei]
MRIGRVARDRDRGGAERLRDRVERLATAAEQHDPAARFDELARDGRADARAAARDQRDLVVERMHD